MKDWQKLLIPPSVSIRETLQAIEANANQIALVVDENRRLMGTVTDGDIRRGILKGISLDASVQQVMNLHPTVASPGTGVKSILALMKLKSLRQIPIVDEDDKVVDIEIFDNLVQVKQRYNWVVIMAGGMGMRLRPLTDECPKPLLKVGAKPILETIIENFVEYGFCHFYLAVNYKADMIENYLGDGSQFGAEIRYIKEEKRMGTAGALSLIPEKFEQPLIVMNGDLLTKVNFQQLLDFHVENEAKATICVREYNYQIPYGVVNIERERLVNLEEKPVHNCFVNAGIYVLDPKALEMLPQNMPYDMTELFQSVVKQKQKAVVFPIREYWMDIGQRDDFEKANDEYYSYFNEAAASRAQK